MNELKVVSPYSGEILESLPMEGQVELETKLSKSYALFTDSKNHIPAFKRIEILKRCVTLMKARFDDLVHIATAEGGKPHKDTVIEVKRAINGVELAIQEIAQLKGEQIPMDLTESSVGRIAFTTREPIGVVVSISAFNHPLNLIVHQTVTAFAAGCPVIVKPALETPLTCLAFLQLLYEAGLPNEWCQTLICEDHIAEMLATDSRVGYLSFIGSSKVGWYLRSKLSAGTRCALEHGGIAPVIVEADADISKVIPSILKGGFYHSGQVCVSVQRVFVHDSVCDQMLEGLVRGAQELKVGDPLDPETDLGPLIRPAEVTRIKQWVDEAVSEGARLVTGGKELTNNCFEPTILFHPSVSSKVSTLEIFGPVICVYPYADVDDAIRQANASDMHFQAAVFTNSINNAMSIVKELNAAAVMVNDHTAFRVDWMPFGGRDSSGLGVGGIHYSIHEMTREKLIVLKTS